MVDITVVNHKTYPRINAVNFGHQICPCSHGYGPAIRTHWLLHYVVKGTGKFEREGQTYNVNAGEFFVIPPGIKTYYEADSKDPWEYIWVGFTCDGDLPVTLDPVVYCKSAGSIFEKMTYSGKYNNGTAAYLDGLIWQLMASLLRYNEEPKDESVYVEKAISYMNTEYARGVTIQEIADALNLNRSYFSTVFKNEMGVSPLKYLMNLRFEKAVEIMTNKGGSPTLAALSCGYTDIYQFSKMFKTRFGVSPRQYIKNHTTTK